MNEKLYKASDVIGVLMNVCSDDDYLKATDWLSKIPSAVVRCKDCKHFQPFVGERKKIKAPLKDGWCWNGDCVKYDDFCSEGERKSENPNPNIGKS